MFNFNKIIKKSKEKLRFWVNEFSYSQVDEIEDIQVIADHHKMNILWVVYDSCRYDSMVRAQTPVLDSHAQIYKAYAPATYTLPSHMSFFTGILPLVHEPVPYLNRFQKQLLNMRKAGQAMGSAKGDYTVELRASRHDAIHGLGEAGYYTVGAGAATWFAKKCLTEGFDDFSYRQAQSCEAQCNYLLRNLELNARRKPFFAFMNFIETHTPYMHYGADRKEYAMQARDSMEWPPVHDEEAMNSKGAKLHAAQIAAVEHLDKRMGEFLPKLPPNTFVIITADHGEAFGEDGFWGHGVYHPKVMEIPMSGFMLNGEEPLADFS